MSRFFAFIAFLAFAVGAFAQTVHWDPPAGTLGFNQTTELQLVFDNCEPADDHSEPAVPPVSGLQLQMFGQSTNTSIVNGHLSQSVVMSFRVRAVKRGKITIPAFDVNTNKGKISVPSVSYQVGDPTVGQGNVALDAVANAQIEVPTEVWAGQIFNVDYSLNIARRYFHSPGSNQPEWNPSPLAAEDWSKPEVTESIENGERRIHIEYHTRASIKSPGTVTINSASQLVNLTTGTPTFGFFAQPTLAQYSITTNRPTITVKPLPSPAPTGFNGAVGQFTLQSKIVPTSATVGEPVTWTLTLAGTGNWPDINGLPARDVSRDFRVVQPQARRTIKDGTLYDGTLTEDVVLIPTQPGNYTLGPIVWTYFDPAKSSYETITTDKVVVNVSAAPIPSAALPTQAPGGHPAATANAALPTPTQTPAPPALPSPIPRDVLAEAQLAPQPWRTGTFALALLAPVPVFFLGWLGLAWRRARNTDPLRLQRQARAAAQRTLAELAGAKDGERLRTLLQRWQAESAVLWRIESAVPTAAEVKSVAGVEWERLWNEAEQVLYRSNSQLPNDWLGRAQAALQAKIVPGFSPVQLFLPRNLLPFAAALLVAFVVGHPLHGADPAHDAYAQGNFTEAEADWRQAIEHHHNDWVAHHNLAVALAQQNRWGEAAGHAAAAFVQNPRDESVKWELMLTTERAGFVPGSLGAFTSGSATHGFASLLSPAEWQRFLVGAVTLIVLGGVLFLLRLYEIGGRWLSGVAIACLTLGVAAGISGTIGLTLYEEAADARSVLVWKPSVLRSIPTEADTTQKTSPLSAGTLAIVDKTFLTWSRLSFPNGQTGWVRQDDFVPLW